MELQTSRFGELKISENEVYTFPKGIPGFEDQNAFVIVAPEEDTPFSFLQSVKEANILFVIADPFLFYPEYDFELPESTAEELQINSAEQVIVRCIVTFRNDLESSTINLVAPVIFNAQARLGKQVVLAQSRYNPKHPLFASSKRR